MRKHPSQPLGVSRENLACDAKLSRLPGRGAKPRLEREVKALAYRSNAHKKRGELRIGPSFRGGEENSFVVSVEVPDQFRRGNARIDERLSDELGGTQDEVGELVFRLLACEQLGVECVLVLSRKRHADAFTLLCHDAICEARVRVRSLENTRDPKFACGFERP